MSNDLRVAVFTDKLRLFLPEWAFSDCAGYLLKYKIRMNAYLLKLIDPTLLLNFSRSVVNQQEKY